MRDVVWTLDAADGELTVRTAVAGRAARMGHRLTLAMTRWQATVNWVDGEPNTAELVVEVAYEHMQGDRFRHMAQFRRWRLDKKPSDCTYAQLEVVAPQELMAIFPAGR